ncbi:MAG: WcaF family extracellular polysaccharide biosynthesis acetyltransferase [Pseudomonadota bacterium]|nr:WcaF family extracellular polysaccharide biosynthesis acetyltransferase [Pseudomonadota bacterium]
MCRYQLDKFRVPKGFRGKNFIIVQLWWFVQLFLFSTSPQFCYGWRRFLLRAFGAKIGKNVIIRPSVKITYPWKVELGNNTWVGDDVVLYSLGNITIGENSVVSQKSYICTGSHDYRKATFDIYSLDVVIGKGVWLATDVYVGPGVVICDGAIVGARSSVFKSLKNEALYLGSPVKEIKKI